AEPDVARRLAVAPRTAVIRLDILRSVDRVPVSAATTWLPAERAPNAGRIYRDTRSLTRTLAQLGINDFRRQSTRISAAIADAGDAARLRLAPGRRLIVVDSTDVTADGRPTLPTRARLAADRIELVIRPDRPLTAGTGIVIGLSRTGGKCEIPVRPCRSMP